MVKSSGENGDSTLGVVLVAIMDSSAMLFLGQAVMFSLMGFFSAVLTVMLAAWPLFAPAHFLSLIIQVHHLVCEFPDVLLILFLSLIQPDSVSTVRRQVRHAWLLQVLVDRHHSLLREAFPGHRGR